MIATKKDVPFSPVTLTLETLEEVEALYQLGNRRSGVCSHLGDCGAQFSPTRKVTKEQMYAVLFDVYITLGDVLK